MRSASCGERANAAKRPLRPSRIDAGPLMPSPASRAATRPPSADQPPCSALDVAPLARNSNTPDDWLPAMPKACTVRRASKPERCATAAAAANGPATEVA